MAMNRDALQTRKMLAAGPMLHAIAAGIQAGETGLLLSEARRRLHSDWRHFGLRRDLDVPFDRPKAKVQITIRPLRNEDVPKLLGMRDKQMAPRGPYVRMHRLRFVRQGLGQCWVAVRSEDDEPCYMQWLIGAAENEGIERYFGGIFPRLGPDEALLEYAFTPEQFQGQGIMPDAMAQIAEQARDLGAVRVITFVDHTNAAALKGCHRAGFQEYVTRIDHWRLFRRTPSFEPI
jgi:RimJ/RimL family protein N-acetyltransferase